MDTPDEYHELISDAGGRTLHIASMCVLWGLRVYSYTSRCDDDALPANVLLVAFLMNVHAIVLYIPRIMSLFLLRPKSGENAYGNHRMNTQLRQNLLRYKYPFSIGQRAAVVSYPSIITNSIDVVIVFRGGDS